jgi:hypothetical protein
MSLYTHTPSFRIGQRSKILKFITSGVEGAKEGADFDEFLCRLREPARDCVA